MPILPPITAPLRPPSSIPGAAPLYSTLLLDTVAWDLVLDSNANIALAAPPYAVAQDVASAIRLFLGELWYDTTQGVPYSQILGQALSVSRLSQYLEAAALTVSGVVKAGVIVISFLEREVRGQVQFVTDDGVSTTINFS